MFWPVMPDAERLAPPLPPALQPIAVFAAIPTPPLFVAVQPVAAEVEIPVVPF